MGEGTTPSLTQAKAVLQSLFGFPDFRPGQADVIERALAGRDTLAVMPTGSGKSVCYQLPAALLPGCVVVISPLIALMKDQLQSLPEPLARVSTFINSSLDQEAIEQRLAALAEGRIKLLYAAPERLRQWSFVHALQQAQVSLFVVDEAHCIALWGHDFRPDYLFIREALRLTGEPPLLALTATATRPMVTEIAGQLGRPLQLVQTGVLRPNLRLEVRKLPLPAKHAVLVRMCLDLAGSGIVYVNYRERARDVAERLRAAGVQAAHYHAGLPAEQRAASQEAFMAGRTRIMVATIAFGMGIDKPDVRFIIHFDPPHSLESYVQESGRAGRDGDPARCIAFVSREDPPRLREWMEAERPKLESLRALYRAVRAHARDGFARANARDLAAELLGTTEDDLDESNLAVLLGFLECGGLLKRHLDVARSIGLRLESSPSPLEGKGEGSDGREPGLPPSSRGRVGDRGNLPSQPQAQDWKDFEYFAGAAGLTRNEWLPADPLDLAQSTGIQATLIESKLLDWEGQGWLSWQGIGRDWLVQVPPAPADAARRVPALLATLEGAQQRRLRDLFDYLYGRTCRHAHIAAHFGVPGPPECGMCENCLPEPKPASRSPRRTRR